MEEILVTIKIVLADEKEKIKPQDLFFFYQSDGTPTIRKCKPSEADEWDGYTNSITGEKSYRKIKHIEGLLISPKNY